MGIIRVAIFRVAIFRVGAFLGGSFPGGNFPGWEFSGWGFSGWELCGWNFPGGSFGNYPGWKLSMWDLSWVGIFFGGIFSRGNCPVRIIRMAVFRVGVFMLPKEKRIKLLNFTLQFRIKIPHGNSNVKNDDYNKTKHKIQKQMQHKYMKIEIKEDRK